MFMPGVWFLWSKFFLFIIFQKENGNTFTLLIIFIVKSLQKEQSSTNLLLWPPICRNKPAITPKWFNSLDTNSIIHTIIFCKLESNPLFSELWFYHNPHHHNLYLSSLVFATIKHEKCKLIVDFMEFSEGYCAVFNFPKNP